ncbi:helix-turn-helix transcriptional regulator [Natronobeatus ordinarius]|uniref:helix-turn-helix transcriptional regulator n=1 Tax=Natronobeatus ordinarius TaxID=2963433 RepID=UPI0020CE886B|nr:MarR family transcriptional regulator [Natronobeatus ordinarius]
MSVLNFRSGDLLAAVLLLTSAMLLTYQLLNPVPVIVSVEGTTLQVNSIDSVVVHSYANMAIIISAAISIGASGMYLYLSETSPSKAIDGSETREDHVSSAVAAAPTDRSADESGTSTPRIAPDSFSENERTIYQLVLEHDGQLEQRKIVDQTDLSKATVSRTLDRLEMKGVLERRRRGVGNVVVLRSVVS